MPRTETYSYICTNPKVFGRPRTLEGLRQEDQPQVPQMRQVPDPHQRRAQGHPAQPMSNTGPLPPTPAGAFKRTCEGCGETFCTDSARQKYCSPACKRRAQNARHYKKHQEKIVARNLRNQKRNARTPI